MAQRWPQQGETWFSEPRRMVATIVSAGGTSVTVKSKWKTHRIPLGEFASIAKQWRLTKTADGQPWPTRQAPVKTYTLSDAERRALYAVRPFRSYGRG